MVFSPGLEPVTFIVPDCRDNQYTKRNQHVSYRPFKAARMYDDLTFKEVV